MGEKSRASQNYLAHAMLGYENGKPVGQLAVMPEIMQGLNDDDIRALAHFLAYLR